MFDKEAYEYEKEKIDLATSMMNPQIETVTRQAYTEFGYNKAKKDSDKMKSQFLELCNLKDMRIAKMEKANEWHEIESKISPKREISKKYMPKSEEKVLLKYHFSGDNEIHISDGYYDAYDFQFHIANNPKFRIVCVIAWKEIVLPELPKE